MRSLGSFTDVPAFLHDRLAFLARAAATRGDVAELRLGTPTCLLNDPADIRHVLVGNHAAYAKTDRLTSVAGRRIAGDGVLTSAGERHRRLRRVLQRLFHPGRVSAFADGIVRLAARRAAAWPVGGRVDMAREMEELARRVMLEALFGELPDADAVRLGAAVEARRRYIEFWFLSLLPARDRLPTRVRRRYRRAMAVLDDAVYAAIAARRRGGAGSEDLIAQLVGARDEDGAALTDREVRDEVLTLAITGHETLGEALTWTWYLLAQHPGVEQKLLDELGSVLDGRAPAAGDLPRLEYTHTVLAESLRLYPPTWIFVRNAVEDDVLPTGAAVSRGTKLYLCPYVTHRDARFFPDPQRFDPERFGPSARRARPKLAYFPFGSGPRVCLGETFARMEALLVLAAIAPRFRLAVAPGQTVVPEPRITLRPRHGLRMLVARR